VTVIHRPGPVELRTEYDLLRAEYAELLAHARAAVAAARLGQAAPLAFLEGHLAEHGQDPPPGAQPAAEVARAYAAAVDAYLSGLVKGKYRRMRTAVGLASVVLGLIVVAVMVVGVIV
jgi:hypothetical protein